MRKSLLSAALLAAVLALGIADPKPEILVFGAASSLEANGVTLENAEVGVGTSDHAHAILTNGRFSNLKLTAIAQSNSELKFINPVFDRTKPVCLSRGGRADCGTP